MSRRLALSAALLAALPFSAGAAEKRAFAIADLYAVKGVAEPAIAPDGRSVAFAVTTTDLPAIRRQTNLWRVDADGKGPRALTLSDKRDASPAFSPDGSVLAFLSTRAGDPQVFAVGPDGAGAERRLRREGREGEAVAYSNCTTRSATPTFGGGIGGTLAGRLRASFTSARTLAEKPVISVHS